MDATSTTSSSSTSLETKYHKLATEYSKVHVTHTLHASTHIAITYATKPLITLCHSFQQVRGQASVLKRGLLDEQQKSTALRETLRQRDTSLRRCEQELDSLGFRNKQLEHRVSALQDDLRRDPRALLAAGAGAANAAGGQQPHRQSNAHSAGHNDIDLLSDELRMRIVENARLAMQLADQTADQQRLADRCAELERRCSRQQAEHSELEMRLRKDLDAMCGRAAELERRLSSSCGRGNGTANTCSNSGGCSVACSEDTLSVSDDPEPAATAAPTADADATQSSEQSEAARVVQLQRELFQVRTQLEFAALRDMPAAVLAEKTSALRRASNGPLGAPWTVSRREAKEAADAAALAKQTGQSTTMAGKPANDVDGGGDATQSAEQSDAVEREKWVQRHFSEKLDRLFAEKLEAESKAASYAKEVRIYSTRDL